MRLVNAHVDYAEHFPRGYEAGHMAGLRLLRVIDRARSTYGPDVVGPIYAALGARLFDTEAPASKDSDPRGLDYRGTPTFLTPILADLGLPAALVEALDDESLDFGIRAETDAALALTGKDVGTPIVQFDPPGGVAFFGPVISRLPHQDDAVRLWDHVIGLASFPGFSELKRSLRELPQLRGLGVGEGEIGLEQDWHGGSRRTNG